MFAAEFGWDHKQVMGLPVRSFEAHVARFDKQLQSKGGGV